MSKHIHGIAARASLAESVQTDAGQYLTFLLGGEVFGLAIQPIREILEYTPPTDVPMVPGFIRGVLNVRGSVVPVIDLALRLGRTANPVSRKTCVIIVELQLQGQQHLLGLVVDQVNEVLELDATAIEASPSFGMALRADFIAGFGKVAGRFLVLLDLYRVLDSAEMSSLVREQNNIAVELAS